MTVLERVERARRTLRAAAVTAAVLRGFAVALGLLLLSATVDAFVSLPAGVRQLVPFVAAVAAIGVCLRRLRRAGVRSDTGSAALWIEARFPSLRYALVTAVDPRYTGTVPEIERVAAAGRVRAGGAEGGAACAARLRRSPWCPSPWFCCCSPLAPSRASSAPPRATRSVARARRSRTNPLATVVVHVSRPRMPACMTRRSRTLRRCGRSLEAP